MLSEPLGRAGERGGHGAAVWCHAGACGRTEPRAVTVGCETKTLGPVLAHALRRKSSSGIRLFCKKADLFSNKSAVLWNRDIKNDLTRKAACKGV